MNELHYEIGNIIYSGSVIHHFSTLNNSITEAPKEVGSDSRTKRTDTLQAIRLVPISYAKAELL